MILMTRGEANTVCIGDVVYTMGNQKCKVVDLEFVVDSNDQNEILATLKDQYTGKIIKTNLELTHQH